MKEIIFFGSFYFEITPPVNPYPESALNEDVNKSFHAHRVWMTNRCIYQGITIEDKQTDI